MIHLVSKKDKFGKTKTLKNVQQNLSLDSHYYTIRANIFNREVPFCKYFNIYIYKYPCMSGSDFNTLLEGLGGVFSIQ